jgi:hypothetical protein
VCDALDRALCYEERTVELDFRRHFQGRPVTLFIAALSIAIVGVLSLGDQNRSSAAEQLVSTLTTNGRGCAIDNFTFRSKHAALALIAMGDTARPYLERAVNDLEAGGSVNPCGIEWLLYAYARVKGASGYERLSRMLERPQLSSHSRAIEIAMAGSMEFTSVISSRDKHGHLYGQTEQLGGLPPFVIPQQALDSIILGLLRAEEKLVHGALSQRAQQSLKRIVDTDGWSRQQRKRLAPDAQNSLLLVTYRLTLPNGIVEPLRPDFRVSTNFQDRQLDGTVEFYTGRNICASQRIRFIDLQGRVETRGYPDWKFVIDGDIDALLTSIGKCVQQLRTVRSSSDN